MTTDQAAGCRCQYVQLASVCWGAAARIEANWGGAGRVCADRNCQCQRRAHKQTSPQLLSQRQGSQTQALHRLTLPGKLEADTAVGARQHDALRPLDDDLAIDECGGGGCGTGGGWGDGGTDCGEPAEAAAAVEIRW